VRGFFVDKKKCSGAKQKTTLRSPAVISSQKVKNAPVRSRDLRNYKQLRGSAEGA
jgi:hypothetical protein